MVTLPLKVAARLPIRRSRPDGQLLLVLLLVAVVCALVLLPVGTMLIATLRPPEVLPFEDAGFTTANLAKVFTDLQTYRLLANTFLYVGLSLTLGLAIAVPLTWLVERSDMPFAGAIPTLLLIPVAIPVLVTGLAWVLLLSPTIGVVNVFLRGLLGLGDVRGPLTIYSLPGMVFVTGMVMVPTMFLMLSGLFRGLSSQLEEAAAVSGANMSTALRRVTLPLLAPGLLSIIVYYTVAGMDFLEIPMVIGPNANFYVLSLEIFSRTHPIPGIPLYGLAAAYGLIGIAISLPLMHMYARTTRAAETYAVITGRATVQQRVRLGHFRHVALALVCCYLFVAVVLPASVIIWTSFLPFFRAPSAESIARITLANYVSVIQHPRIILAGQNTLMILISAATGTMLLAALIAWVVVRVRKQAVRWLDTIAFLPLAIPGVIIALAILLFYIRTPLWGTIWVIVLGQAVLFLPVGLRIMHAAQLQVHRELEEAALTSGAFGLSVFKRITAPLLVPSLANGWLWVAMSSMRDFTFPIILVSIENVTITSLLWELWQVPNIPQSAAVASLLMLASVILMIATRVLFFRSK